VQDLGSAARERMPTAYYAPSSGVGVAVAAAPAIFGNNARIGVVGLGSGTLACYSRTGQKWTFYEIDPVIVDIARDPKQFTFLSRCLPRAEVIVGDARLSLQNAPAGGADLLVVDAFSSDSIPIHLLTREAFAAYRRHLGPDGLLMVHITNRYLDLEPVVAAASRGEWHMRLRSYVPTPADAGRSYARSRWIALSPSASTLERLGADNHQEWRPLKASRMNAWTDDHASLLPLIRW
jgi:spermidine synthase